MRFWALYRYSHHRSDVADQLDVRRLAGAIMDEHLLNQTAQDFESFCLGVFLLESVTKGGHFAAIGVREIGM